MKKLLRLISPFLIASLLLVCFNVVLADPFVLTSQAGEIVVQTGVDPAPAGQGALEDESIPGSSITPTLPAGQSTQSDGSVTVMAITGLSITHSSPAVVNIPVQFTATIASGAGPIIQYDWSFGDGSPTLFNAGPLVPHSYNLPGTYTVVVTARDVDGSVMESILLTVIVEPLTGLSISHSSPALIKISTYFTAAISSGSSPIQYEWSFGDGSLPQFTNDFAVDHTYNVSDTYTVVVTATNAAGSDIETIMLTVIAEPITGLFIEHTSPVPINSPTYFTAMVTGGSPPIVYAWSFGDGSLPLFNAGPMVSHTYTTIGDYTVEVAASNGVPPPATFSLPINFTSPSYNTVYLPLVLKTSPADLSCSLSINTAGETDSIIVRIYNQGGSNADGFWVDLYINPSAVPGPGNLFRWQDVCGPSCPGGLAWRISNTPLLPGNSRNLVSISSDLHPDGYDPTHSSWSASLPAGTYNLYAYVDSINNFNPAYDGAVNESNETNNRCEIWGLVVSGFRSFEIEPRPNTFPPRPTP